MTKKQKKRKPNGCSSQESITNQPEETAQTQKVEFAAGDKALTQNGNIVDILEIREEGYLAVIKYSNGLTHMRSALILRPLNKLP